MDSAQEVYPASGTLQHATMSLVTSSSPRFQGPPSIIERLPQDVTDRHMKIRQFKTTLRGTLTRGIIDEKQVRTSAITQSMLAIGSDFSF
jgi:hypothetical protein